VVRNPVSVDLPFRFGADGSLATTRDPDRQIRQRLIGLIGTNPGERVMLPRLGVGVARLVFEPDIGLVNAELTTKIKNQAATYEPGASIARVTPHPEASAGQALLDVEYTRTDTARSGQSISRYVHRAVVGPGGIIREVLRG
jgi:phage baseplate assembly protein W